MFKPCVSLIKNKHLSKKKTSRKDSNYFLLEHNLNRIEKGIQKQICNELEIRMYRHSNIGNKTPMS